MNSSEKQERQYLKEIKDRLQANLELIDERVKQQAQELQETKRYLYENKNGYGSCGESIGAPIY